MCNACPMSAVCADGRRDSSLDNELHSALTEGLPIKASRVLKTLFKNDKAHAIRAEIKHKRNAIKDQSPKFLSVALDELVGGGFDKRSLRRALMSRLNCTDKTAFGWVSITVPVLNALNVIKEQHGFYRIKNES